MWMWMCVNSELVVCEISKVSYLPDLSMQQERAIQFEVQSSKSQIRTDPF